MNKFDERYEIRLAQIEDTDLIMKFIDKHWKQGHIMSTDKILFNYEFTEGSQVNFIIAIDKNTGSLEAVFGFLYCSHTRNPENRDLWGSMWKVNDSCENLPLLGIELAKRVYSLTNCRMHIGSGANPNTTVPLRRIFFKDKTARMKQYYMLNPLIRDFSIARVVEKRESKTVQKKIKAEVTEFKGIKQIKEDFPLEQLDLYPYKDFWYVEKRYFKHPYYRYLVYGIKIRDEIKALMICREVAEKGKKILRIVDYIGMQEVFGGIADFFHNLFQEKAYEYIDFYEFGFHDRILRQAGFVYRDDQDKNIIPNYFEPFIQENIDIWVHYKFDGTTFFKADCDQDRPNIHP